MKNLGIFESEERNKVFTQNAFFSNKKQTLSEKHLREVLGELENKLLSHENVKLAHLPIARYNDQDYAITEYKSAEDIISHVENCGECILYAPYSVDDEVVFKALLIPKKLSIEEINKQAFLVMFNINSVKKKTNISDEHHSTLERSFVKLIEMFGDYIGETNIAE